MIAIALCTFCVSNLKRSNLVSFVIPRTFMSVGISSLYKASFVQREVAHGIYTSQYCVEFAGSFGHIRISMLPYAVLTLLVLLVSLP